MNAQQVATELGVTERTVRRALAAGRLTGVKRGRSWDIDVADARRAIGNGAVVAPYQDALAEALHLLRSFGHEADAEDLERRYGIKYITPRPRVIFTLAGGSQI